MRKLFWIAGSGAAAICVASLIPGPYASVTQASPAVAASFQTAQLDQNTTATLRRACGNCHSNTTQWPWYSQIAPVSWLVRKDVSEGRTFLNFSTWQEYGPEGQRQLLALSSAQMKAGTMPPQRYLLLHAEAKLSDAEQSKLIGALERESNRLSKPRESTPLTSGDH